MIEDLSPTTNRKDYHSKKDSNLSQVEILELAVKVVVHPTYGWITTALILYGCRPVETFSLIPLSNGKASVINFDENPLKNMRREVLANPLDFVDKLNICDQISQPVFYENFEDYNFDELNIIISNWKSWFRGIKSNLNLDDLRAFWKKRMLSDGFNREFVEEYMG